MEYYTYIMVYYTYNYGFHGGFVNQRSHHWGTRPMQVMKSTTSRTGRLCCDAVDTFWCRKWVKKPQ
jgi:hypothetical protein